MTAEVTAWLDGLDAARTAAAMGTLRVGEHYGIHLYAGQEPIGTTLNPADAACTVAEHNAGPVYDAMIRAVLALCDDADRRGWLLYAGAGTEPPQPVVFVSALRAAVASALTRPDDERNQRP